MAFFGTLFEGKQDNSQKKLLEFDDRIKALAAEMDYVKRELKNIEILALEAKEKYAKKLKKLLPKDEEEENAAPSDEFTPTGEKILR